MYEAVLRMPHLQRSTRPADAPIVETHEKEIDGDRCIEWDERKRAVEVDLIIVLV
jgi:hypothetical protein